MIKETWHAGTESTLTKLQKQTKSFKLQCLSWLLSCKSMPSIQAFLCHFFRNFTRQRCPKVHVWTLVFWNRCKKMLSLCSFKQKQAVLKKAHHQAYISQNYVETLVSAFGCTFVSFLFVFFIFFAVLKRIQTKNIRTGQLQNRQAKDQMSGPQSAPVSELTHTHGLPRTSLFIL